MKDKLIIIAGDVLISGFCATIVTAVVFVAPFLLTRDVVTLSATAELVFVSLFLIVMFFMLIFQVVFGE
jgi:hypothetical protein